MTHVLVTGGAGFIGSHLTDRLLAAGARVTVVDDLSTGRLANLTAARRDPDLPLDFVRLDIVSDGLERAVAKAAPDVVVHLAAQVDVTRSVAEPVRDAWVNVVGTVNLLEACRRHDVAKVVLASSGDCIYGEPPVEALPISEGHPGHPQSPHGAAKRGIEEYLRAYAHRYGLHWTALALATAYGPRQDPEDEAAVVAFLGSRMLDGHDVLLHGDGEQTRDLVFVDDVVDAFVAAIDRGDGMRLNIGTGVRTSVNALFSELADATGYTKHPSYAPARPGELANIALDCSAAERQLGWRSRTSLREGLEATLDWLRG